MTLRACLPGLVADGKLSAEQAGEAGAMFDEIAAQYARQFDPEMAAAMAGTATLDALEKAASRKRFLAGKTIAARKRQSFDKLRTDVFGRNSINNRTTPGTASGEQMMSETAGWTRRSALALGGAGLAAIATRGMAASEYDIEVMAEGLGFCEGPVVMPDGSVLVVDLISANITRVWKGGKEVVANVGGGPNGAQLGPDGALYICNNGGAAPDNHSLADPGQPGRVERLDLATGKVERLFDKVGEIALSAPNDLVFDADGGFYFTDYGKTLAECYARGGVYYCSADRAVVKPIVRNGTGFNGVGLSPDGKTLYYNRYFEGRLMRMTVTGPGEVEMEEGTTRPRIELVGSGFGEAEFDGMAVTAAGNICIGTNHTGGLTTITPEGDVSFLFLPERMVTNVAFGGQDMRDAYLTWSTSGRLVRMRMDEPGLKLNFA